MLLAMRNRGLNKLQLENKPTREEDQSTSKENPDKYFAIFDQSPIGAQLYDSQGRLEHINRACLDIFGVVDQEEFTGSNLFYDPNIPAEARSQLLEGQPVRIECDVDFDITKDLNVFQTTKTGVRRLDMSITPLRSAEGLSGYLAQIQDVTEQIQVENHEIASRPIDDAAETKGPEGFAQEGPESFQTGTSTGSSEDTDFRPSDNRRVFEKLRAALEMAGKVCHQLNQPLQIILSNAELMLETETHDTKTKKSLDSIKAQIHRMATMTSHLISIKEYAIRKEDTNRR